MDPSRWNKVFFNKKWVFETKAKPWLQHLTQVLISKQDRIGEYQGLWGGGLRCDSLMLNQICILVSNEHRYFPCCAAQLNSNKYIIIFVADNIPLPDQSPSCLYWPVLFCKGLLHCLHPSLVPTIFVIMLAFLPSK